jgi:hypothetical protein
MKTSTPRLPAVPMLAAASLLLTTAPASGAQEEPFEEARLFFELNDTDGDLGFHGLIDGDAWKRLEIEAPDEQVLLDARVLGRLRQQGLTEVFFESAEPPFDELPPAEFLRRFPAGVYEISGVTLDGTELESTSRISHVLPGPPRNIKINNIPSAPNCDSDPLPAAAGAVTINWDPVTRSHPTIGVRNVPVNIEKYTFVVEREEPTLLIFSVELPPGVTAFRVPQRFLALGDEFKFEIQAKARNGNQTVVESCFEFEGN